MSFRLSSAVLGLGLILAFGLTMAVGRYETRRVALVADANTIGTTGDPPRSVGSLPTAARCSVCSGRRPETHCAWSG